LKFVTILTTKDSRHFQLMKIYDGIVTLFQEIEYREKIAYNSGKQYLRNPQKCSASGSIALDQRVQHTKYLRCNSANLTLLKQEKHYFFLHLADS